MKKRNTVFWIFSKIRRRIPALCVMTVAHVGTALLGVAFALGSRNVIDSAVAGDRDAFIYACIMQGAVIVGTLLCLAIYRHLHERLLADLDKDWKSSLLHGLLHGDYSEVSGYHSGELINRLNNDVRTVNDGILSVLPSGAAMLIRVIAAVIVLAGMEPRFTVLVVSGGVVVLAVTGFLRRRLKRLHKKVSEQDGKVSGFLQEILEKLLMVQAMDLSGEVESRADKLLIERYFFQRKRKNISVLANMAVSILSYGAGFVALIWCSARMLNGTMSFGSLTAITQLVSQVQMPFTNLSSVIPKYIAMTAAAERLIELEEISHLPEDTLTDGSAAYAQMRGIGADSVSFSYDRDQILENASFAMPKGAFAVVTGPSGIGKSTLLKLFLGVFRPDKGTLYLNVGGERLTLGRSTRKLFAYVPQGNLLLSGTLRDNLLITKPDASEEQIRQAVYVSAMDEYLSQLPKGLDTPLGENAAGLSEGQAQRLAIARAVLGGAPILLLDECTSALDERTEKTVLERIRGLHDRTCIVVTHRPAAVEMCDWRLEIGNGTVNAFKAE